MNGKTADGKKLIYICSPLKGDISGNIAKARGYCKTVLAMGCIPIAPHVMLDGILNDESPAERQTALEMGRGLVTCCAELWIFTNVISQGMQAEIDLARERHIPVKRVCFNFERQAGPQQAAPSEKKKFMRLTTDNPKGMWEEIHNALIVKDREVYLRDWNGEGDMNLCKFCAEQCRKWCDIDLSGVPAEEFGEFMDCDCTVAALYHIAVGYAENRLKLKEYEDAEENGHFPDPALEKAFELAARYIQENADCPAAALNITPWPKCDGETGNCGDERERWKCWIKLFRERAGLQDSLQHVVFKDGACPVCGGDTHGINSEPMKCEKCGWTEPAEKEAPAK